MIDQGELFDIPNPCKGVCVSNNRGFCKGCLRSREERFHWHELTPFQKYQVINLCEKRRQKIIAAKLAKQNQVLASDENPISPQTELFKDESDHKKRPNPEALITPSSRESLREDNQIQLFKPDQ